MSKMMHVQRHVVPDAVEVMDNNLVILRSLQLRWTLRILSCPNVCSHHCWFISRLLWWVYSRSHWSWIMYSAAWSSALAHDPLRDELTLAWALEANTSTLSDITHSLTPVLCRGLCRGLCQLVQALRHLTAALQWTFFVVKPLAHDSHTNSWY